MEEKILVTEYKPNMLAFKTALAYCVYFLILLYLLKFLGIDQNDPDTTIIEKIVVSALTYVPFILGILYVQTTHKAALGGYISFVKAFSSGFKTAAYTGLFLAIVMFLYYKVLDTEAYTKMLDTAREQAGDDPEKLKGMEVMMPYMIYFIAFGVAVSDTLLGLVLSLISAAFIKKERPLYEEV